MIAFWLSFHSLGFWMCELVWRKIFACLYVYWWVCERRTEGVCSSVCANEPLIFRICPSVCICLTNQISQLDVSRLSAPVVFISLFLCMRTCTCACLDFYLLCACEHAFVSGGEVTGSTMGDSGGLFWGHNLCLTNHWLSCSGSQCCQ